MVDRRISVRYRCSVGYPVRAPSFGRTLVRRRTVINLYVGNLPFTTTSDDLADMFAKCGNVVSAQVVIDRESGRSRGFGFVEMSDDDARKAIDELGGTNMGGRPITVNEARPRAPRPPRHDR